MLHKTFFCKKWGGAAMLLLFKIFTIHSLCPPNVWAQPMGCFDWRIEICSEVKPPAFVHPSCTNPFPYNPCNSVYYYVYLSKSANPDDVITPFQFYFSEFNLSGSVIVTPSPTTSRKTSKPNEGVSLMCSPPGLNDSNDPTRPLYGVDEIQKTFSYKVIDSGTPINWTVLGRRLLCVLAVDAYPGEIIEIGQLSGSVKFFNGTVCNLIFSGCDGGLIPSYQVVPPTPCIATGFQLRQGTAAAAPLPGYPNRKKIPVYVFSQPNGTYNIQRLDFLMKVESPALMAEVSLEAGMFPAEELVLYDETTGPVTNKRIFADYRAISINATNTATVDNTLFYIILDGPQLSSDCGNTTVAFTDNRRLLLAPNGSCCQPGIVGGPQLVEWNTPINLTATFPQNLIRFGFDATDACIEAVTFRDAIFTEQNASVQCLPTTVSEIKGAVLADDICITSLTMTCELHFGPMMEELSYRAGDDNPDPMNMDPITCERIGLASGTGSNAICACYLPNQPQWVYPAKDDNPLNGVTTYDLVLISKHILVIEPLDSPYKIIAADANKSGHVSSIDIVELRKLILGIYVDLPNNDSYRFIDKSFQFPNPANPFQTTFPEWVQVTIPPLGTIAAFKGVKIGDVNNTALGANLLTNDDRTVTTMPLGFVPSSGKKGAMLRIPVFAQDALGCNSWQMGIGYDPVQWKLTNVVWASQMGEMPEQAWNEPSPGNIRLLSYNAIGDLVLLPKGTPLFYLEGELLQDASDIRLWLNDEMEGFPSESYGINGDRGVFNLLAAEEAQMVALPPPNPSSNKDTWSADIYPNPAGKAFRVQLTGPEDGAGSIRFFNSLGQVVVEQSIGLIKGGNIITSACLPVIPAGQYIVEIAAPWGKKSLRLVKN